MANPICKCSDPNCPKCKGNCTNKAVTVVTRIDMEDRTGTPVCRACADDCLAAGVFNDEPWKMKHHSINAKPEPKPVDPQLLASMASAFEFGFRVGEKGQMNLQAAMAHFYKTMQG